MYASVIQLQFDFGAWADERVFAAASRLTQEEFTTPGTAGHGSIRDTLLHMLSAHWGWLSWFDGSASVEEARRRRFDPEQFPDFEAVRGCWDKVQAQTRAFLATANDETLTRPMDLFGHAVPMWQLLLHVANHNTQHRSEVAAMLTDFGHSPGDLDLLFYLASIVAPEDGKRA